MGFVDKTPEGRYRAYFRDPAGRQRSKTFRVEKDATAFLAEVESTKSRGTFVSPHAGRVLFGEHARRWMATWNTERTTAAKDRSIMETHVLPRWGDVPLGKVDHIGLQEWVTALGTRRQPATVGLALRLASAVLRSAVRTGSSPSTRPRTSASRGFAAATPTSGSSAGPPCARRSYRRSPSDTGA